MAEPVRRQRSTVVGASRFVDRVFVNPAFFRLWVGQVVSSLGDWVGFLALLAVATRIGGKASDGAISVVMTARMLPGFFLAPAAGVIIDRWDRKRVMFVCDAGRALVLCAVPFIDTLPGLFVASLLLELGTLLWSPAKEASVPNLVPPDRLATANSLSVAAAYGPFPVATLLFAALAALGERLSEGALFAALRLDHGGLPLYVDMLTFLVSAGIVLSLPIPARAPVRANLELPKLGLASAGRELVEGYRFIFVSPVVRSVMLAIGVALVGGGMLVPLGPTFSKVVLQRGDAGFGLLLTALGCGGALGVVTISSLQSRLPKTPMFLGSVFVAGTFLGVGASLSTLAPVMACVALTGVGAAGVYVLGFTILQQTADDEVRGRIFATLYTLIRLCLLLAFFFGPLLSGLLNKLSKDLVGGEIVAGSFRLALPGVRLTLWLAALIIVLAGLAAVASLRLVPGGRSEAADPSDLLVASFGPRVARPASGGGRFVVLEGGDGVGKSTQAARLATRLDAVSTRAPGGTGVGVALRSLLLDPAGTALDPKAELLLLAADRAQHVTEVIAPALAAGRDVVCDRFVGSTLAYQGHGRGLDAEAIRQLSDWASDGLQPDLVVLLDLAPAAAAARRSGVEDDRMEAEPDGFHDRVAAGFLALAADDPDRWVVVDASGSEDDVWDRIWSAVEPRLAAARRTGP